MTAIRKTDIGPLTVDLRSGLGTALRYPGTDSAALFDRALPEARPL